MHINMLYILHMNPHRINTFCDKFRWCFCLPLTFGDD